VLARLVSARGAPRYMRSDNGPEFVSHAILKWIEDSNIQTALNDPGKPWQNGTDESFNGRLRDVSQVKARFSRVHQLRNPPAVSAPRVAGSHDRHVPSP
jgi:transposase InsO family protein